MVSKSLPDIANAIAFALVNQFYETKNYLDLHKQGEKYCDREYKDLVAACFVMVHCEISKSISSESTIYVIKDKVFNDVYLQLSDMFSSVEELIDYVNGYTSLHEDDVCSMDNGRLVERVVEGFIYDLPLNGDAAGRLVDEVINQSKLFLTKVSYAINPTKFNESKE